MSATIGWSTPIDSDLAEGAPHDCSPDQLSTRIGPQIACEGNEPQRCRTRDWLQQIGIDVMLRGQSREAKPDAWTPQLGHLTASERAEILLGLDRSKSMSAIARSIGRSPSTVTREVKLNGGRGSYGVWPAHLRAQARTKRPKPSKLANTVLCAKVTSWLEAFWSPQEISNRLRADFPDNKVTRVSHETIYQSLFVQGRGELRRELARCLRSGRTKRKPQGSAKRISNMVMIAERPAEADDRAVPGH